MALRETALAGNRSSYAARSLQDCYLCGSHLSGLTQKHAQLIKLQGLSHTYMALSSDTVNPNRYIFIYTYACTHMWLIIYFLCYTKLFTSSFILDIIHSWTIQATGQCNGIIKAIYTRHFQKSDTEVMLSKSLHNFLSISSDLGCAQHMVSGYRYHFICIVWNDNKKKNTKQNQACFAFIADIQMIGEQGKTRALFFKKGIHALLTVPQILITNCSVFYHKYAL